MRYGHSMGYSLSAFDWILIMLVVGFILSFILRIIKDSNTSNIYTKSLNILKERYARGEIDSDEYTERKAIIEDTDFPKTAELILFERYAKGEINTEEFYTIKNEVDNHHKLFY